MRISLLFILCFGFAQIARAPSFTTTAAYLGGLNSKKSNQLLTSLVAYWKMDENVSSGSRADSIGTHTLTDNGAVGNTASGIINRALSLPGTIHNYLSTPDHADFSGGTSFSIQAWVKWASFSDGQVILGKWATNDEWVLYWQTVPSTFLNWAVKKLDNSANVLVSASNPGNNQWNHICAGFDSVNQVIWMQINGGARSTTAYTTACRDTADPVSVGEYGNDCCTGFVGNVDEFGYWKRVLTSAEVIYLYNSGSARLLSSFQ